MPTHFALKGSIDFHAPNLMSPSTMGFGFSSVSEFPDEADCTAVLALVLAAAADLQSWVASEVVYDQALVISLATFHGPEASHDFVATTGSGGTGKIGVMAGLSSLRTGERGRDKTGRSYSVFVPDGFIDAGFYTPTFIAGLNTVYTNLIVNASTALYPYGVVSVKNDFVSLIQTIETFAHFSYQTRRDPNRG